MRAFIWQLANRYRGGLRTVCLEEAGAAASRSLLPQSCVPFPAVSHPTVHRDLGQADVLKDITLVYSAQDIMLIRPGDQEVRRILHLSKRMSREVGVNPGDIQQNAISIRCVVKGQGLRLAGKFPSKIKRK